MHLHLPIEQLVRREGTPFQFAFAVEARNLLPEGEEFLLNASHKGLRVLARNEDGLAAPVETLRDVYGASLRIEAPRVRLIEGVQVQEPIMHVRISLRTQFGELVKRAMRRRGALPSEEYVRPTYCVLRYEAPLADLLGLGAELARLTDSTAKHWITLSHYALVTRDPGGNAA
jgi:predicted membrane GTPase involved in stress response